VGASGDCRPATHRDSRRCGQRQGRCCPFCLALAIVPQAAASTRTCPHRTVVVLNQADIALAALAPVERAVEIQSQ
jgi:hypothetical protein